MLVSGERDQSGFGGSPSSPDLKRTAHAEEEREEEAKTVYLGLVPGLVARLAALQGKELGGRESVELVWKRFEVGIAIASVT